VANCLRSFLEGYVDGTKLEKWGNVLHFLYSGSAPVNSTCAAIGSAISTQWGSHMAPECPSPTTLESVQTVDLSSPTAGEGTFVGSTSGSRGDDSIAANGAVLISYPSGLRYKGGHPRSYLYCLGNADFTGATQWTAAATAEVQAHWQSFLSAIVGGTFSGTTITGLVSIRYHGKFLPNSGPPHYYLTTPLVNPITISQATASKEIASQRRRIGRAADSSVGLVAKRNSYTAEQLAAIGM
jgi:hypothetical protein